MLVRLWQFRPAQKSPAYIVFKSLMAGMVTNTQKSDMSRLIQEGRQNSVELLMCHCHGCSERAFSAVRRGTFRHNYIGL